MIPNISEYNQAIIERNLAKARAELVMGFKDTRYISPKDALIKAHNLEKYASLDLSDVDLIDTYGSPADYEMSDKHDIEYESQAYLNPAMKGRLNF